MTKSQELNQRRIENINSSFELLNYSTNIAMSREVINISKYSKVDNFIEDIYFFRTEEELTKFLTDLENKMFSIVNSFNETLEIFKEINTFIKERGSEVEIKFKAIGEKGFIVTKIQDGEEDDKELDITQAKQFAEMYLIGLKEFDKQNPLLAILKELANARN